MEEQVVKTRRYELTVVTAGSRSEEENLGKIDDVRQAIEAANGSIVSERPWGQRALTYPIDKQSSGYYQTFVIDLLPSAFETLDQKLKGLALLRFLIVHFVAIPEKVVSSKEGVKVAAEETPVAVAPEERKEKLDAALEGILNE